MLSGVSTNSFHYTEGPKVENNKKVINASRDCVHKSTMYHTVTMKVIGRLCSCTTMLIFKKHEWSLLRKSQQRECSFAKISNWIWGGLALSFALDLALFNYQSQSSHPDGQIQPSWRSKWCIPDPPKSPKANILFFAESARVFRICYVFHKNIENAKGISNFWKKT